MPIPNAERRTYKTEIRAIQSGEGEPRQISGHAAVFNKLSERMWGFYERVLPGAFSDCIPKSDIRCLLNHDQNYVLGRTKSGTLTVTEDAEGLAFVNDPPDTRYANDLLTSIDRQDIDGCSFAFIVGEDRWVTENGVDIREIIRVDELFDVSVVTYPAYGGTDVSARTQEAYREYRSQVEAQNNTQDVDERSEQEAVGSDVPDDNNDTHDAGAAEYRKRQLQLAEIELIGG